MVLTSVPLSALDDGDQLLQTGFWGNFKAAAGWIPRGFEWQGRVSGVDDGGRFLALERRFPGGFSMAYVPYGPQLSDRHSYAVASRVLKSLAGSMRPHLGPRCFVVRFDLCGGTKGPVDGTVEAPPALSAPLKKAPYRVQPPDTVILPLVGTDGKPLDEDGLLAGMHKKSRYNIRLAARKGVEVHRYTGTEALGRLGAWYELYKETGERDRIALHPESYYRLLLAEADSSGGGPSLALYMASHEGDDLGGIIVSRCGGRSTYLYGASSSRKRDFMPNHLLQWTAIRDALSEGAREYDFFGIPPADDPDHPMHGLWRFKTGFGGLLHHYLGAWDYPYFPMLYRLYAVAERFRGYRAARRKRRS